MLRAALVVLALVASAPRVEASAVVLFRTPTHIVLAVDSYREIGDADRSNHSIVCKLRRSGRWWLSPTGYVGGKGKGDVPALAAAAVRGATTLDAVRTAMVASVVPALRDDLAKAVKEDRAFRRMFPTKGQWLSAILFAGQDIGSSTLCVGVLVTVLQAVEPLQLGFSFLSCPGEWCDADERVFFDASVEGPTVTLTTPPLRPWVQRADSAAAAKIIELQMAATPSDVGGPLNVLEITAAGPHWAIRDPASTCSAQIGR